jgi:hypothetical protein
MPVSGSQLIGWAIWWATSGLGGFWALLACMVAALRFRCVRSSVSVLGGGFLSWLRFSIRRHFDGISGLSG